ncbi:beta strand repeat-containing protein [candidate division KSB1 bacterium]
MKKNIRKTYYVNPLYIIMVFMLFGIFCTEKGSINPVDPIYDKIIHFSSFSITESTLNSGGDKADVSVSIVNGKGEKVPGQEVQFSSSSYIGSSIPGQGISDANGNLKVQYTSGNKAGPDTVIAFLYTSENKKVADSLYITINATGTLVLSASEPVILADGISSTQITAELKDVTGNLLSGKEISFVTTIGTIENTSTTDNLGIAKVTYTGAASAVDLSAVVTASINSGKLLKNTQTAADTAVTDTLNVGLRGIILNIYTSSPSLLADGASNTNITATLHTTADSALGSRTISFTTNAGNLSAQTALTNSSGNAKVVITSPTTTGQATITASYGEGITGTTNVDFVDEPPQIPSYIDVFAQLGSLAADEDLSTLSVSAIVSDGNRNPVDDGTLVNFSLESDVGQIRSPVATSNGTAATTLTFPTDAVGKKITIFAVAGDIADTVTITLPGVAGEVSEIQVFPEAGTGSVLADGLSDMTIIAFLLDSDGNPVPNKVINFEVANGYGTIESASVSGSLTDELGNDNPDKGRASVTLTSIADTVDRHPIIRATSGDAEGFSQDTAIVLLGVSLKVRPARDTVRIGESVNINVTLKEKTSNIAISGSEITFGASLGSIEKTRFTDTKGEAVNSLSAGNVPGTAEITVRFGNTIISKTQVVVIQETPYKIIFTEPTGTVSLLADGGSTQDITVQVLDNNNEPFTNATVTFSTGGVGTVSPASVVSDASGIAQAIYTSTASYFSPTAKIVAQSGSVSSDTLDIELRGITMTLKAEAYEDQAYRIVANGRTLTPIIAELQETESGNPIASGTVYFSTSKGTITSSATITDGTATVNLKSPPETGNGTITAKYGSTIQQSISVEYYQSVPGVIGISSSDDNINVSSYGSNTTAQITASVSDVNGEVVIDNTEVTFSSTIGTFSSDKAYTVDGEAVTTLISAYKNSFLKIQQRYNLNFRW